MSKLICNICQDLMTLYVDDLCSEDSKKAVEEHINECEKCKKALESMQSEVKISNLNKKEIEENETFKSSLTAIWKNYKRKTLLKILFVCTSLILALFVGGYLLFFKYYTLPCDNIQINNVCMLSDGSIAFEILTEKGKEGKILRTVPNGEAIYVEMQSTFITQKKNSNYSSYLRVEPDNYQTIYYGNSDNRIVIWEYGMNIPRADDGLENYFSWKIKNQ